MSQVYEGMEFPDRVWVLTDPDNNKWSSREATPDDRARRREFAREWADKRRDRPDG